MFEKYCNQNKFTYKHIHSEKQEERGRKDRVLRFNSG